MSHTTAATQRSQRSWGATAARVLLVWVVLLGVTLGIGWLVTHALSGWVNGWDNDVSRWFAGERTSALDGPADVGTFLGETKVGAAVAVLAAIAFAAWRRTWVPLLMVVLLEAGIGGIYFVATHLEPRDRPPVKILDPGLVPTHSFPSGHVATATAAFGLVVLLARRYAGGPGRWAGVLLLVPVFVLLARLYQGAHHLTDVLTSVLYAGTWLLVLGAALLGRARTDGVSASGGPRGSAR